MLRRMYDWMMRLSAGRHAPAALAAVSFAESSFFPIPPDVMLVPMVLADRSKAWRYATIATVTSVVGVCPVAAARWTERGSRRKSPRC